MQVMAKNHVERYPQNLGICFKKGDPVSPCPNPKIRVAGFLILAKPSLSGAMPSLSGAGPSLSGARKGTFYIHIPQQKWPGRKLAHWAFCRKVFQK